MAHVVCYPVTSPAREAAAAQQRKADLERAVAAQKPTLSLAGAAELGTIERMVVRAEKFLAAHAARPGFGDLVEASQISAELEQLGPVIERKDQVLATDARRATVREQLIKLDQRLASCQRSLLQLIGW